MAYGSPMHKVFCENVRQRRHDLGLTQEEVADLLGVSQPAYAAIEAGRRDPSTRVITKVAKALKCDPAELLTREERAAR